MHKVVNYVVEKMVLDKPLESMDGPFTPGLSGVALQHSSGEGDASLRSGLRPWQRLKPSIEILCNNQYPKKSVYLTSLPRSSQEGDEEEQKKETKERKPLGKKRGCLVQEVPNHALPHRGGEGEGVETKRNSRGKVLSPDMSLATVRAYIWKKPKDLVLNYRIVQGR
ncbi:hypothetical protein Ancab_021324 [Ancistrocladus abbreviatus]